MNRERNGNDFRNNHNVPKKILLKSHSHLGQQQSGLHGAVNRLETSQTCVNFKLQITSGHECSEQICGRDGDWINDPLSASSPFKSIFHTFTIYNYRINYSL